MEKAQNMLLSPYYEDALRAFQGTSFSPEKRAKMYIRDYSQMLEEDLRDLGENPGNYQAKFIEKWRAWMSAKSRCLSSMITGPAKFPTQRNRKALNSEEKRGKEFFAWRERYFKAVNRVPWKSPEDEIELQEQKLVKLQQYQDEYKELNKALRKHKAVDDISAAKVIIEGGFDHSFGRVLQFYGGRAKVPGYVLTNNNARIKNTRDRVKMLLARIDRKNSWEDIIFEGGRVTIEDDRVKIYHDEKPEREVIQEIKRSGFRWSPHWKAWSRKHTGNAIWTVKRLSFVEAALSPA